jgi:hypothetical protein
LVINSKSRSNTKIILYPEDSLFEVDASNPQILAPIPLVVEILSLKQTLPEGDCIAFVSVRGMFARYAGDRRRNTMRSSNHDTA